MPLLVLTEAVATATGTEAATGAAAFRASSPPLTGTLRNPKFYCFFPLESIATLFQVNFLKMFVSDLCLGGNVGIKTL